MNCHDPANACRLMAAIMDAELKQGFYLGEWEVQPLRGQVSGPGGPVHVQPKVMDVLLVLASCPGDVVERDDLIERVWRGRAMGDAPLHRCIAQLRRIFDDSPQDPRFIETVQRRGYRLVAPVVPFAADSEPRSSGEAPEPGLAAPSFWSLRNGLLLVLVAVLLLAIGRYIIFPPDGGRGPDSAPSAGTSIAVLPFDNLGSDSDDYFSDGLSEEIMNRLAGVEGLTVAARTSSFALKGATDGAKSIADKLGVTHLLEGSARIDGDRIRISAYLVDYKGYEIWNARYDGVLTDVFAMQDEISNDIVRQIAPELVAKDSEPRIRTRQPTQNLRAYDLVLQGRYHLARRGEESIRHSISLFDEAIELDAFYGDAYVGLATASALLPFYSNEPRDSSFIRAMAIIEQGAQKDPSVDAGAAGILAFMLYHDQGRWIEAESAFRRALQGSPNDAELLNWYSVFLSGVGRSQEALEYAIQAKNLDRLSPVVNQRLAVAYLWVNRNDLAFEQFRVASELGMAPTSQPEAYLIILLRRGEYDIARLLMVGLQKVMGYDPEWIDYLFRALQDPEERPAAVEAVLRAEQSNDISKLHLFGAWVYLGETERAIDAALQLIQDGTNVNTEFLFAAETAQMRRHPRFVEVVRALKLDTYWEYFGFPEMCQPEGESIVCH